MVEDREDAGQFVERLRLLVESNVGRYDYLRPSEIFTDCVYMFLRNGFYFISGSFDMVCVLLAVAHSMFPGSRG